MAGRLILAGLGILLAVMGAAAAGYLVWAWQVAKRMDGWVERPCRIVSSGVVVGEHPETKRPRYHLEVAYRYSFGGEEYSGGKARRLEVRSGVRKKVEGWAQRYPAGTAGKCWVNPGKPTEAVLKRDSRASIYTVWFPLLFVVGGAGMMVKAVGRGDKVTR